MGVASCYKVVCLGCLAAGAPLDPFHWCAPSCRVLEEKAREHEIPDLTSLYGSDMFRQCGFAYDRTANVITYTSV